MSNKNFQDPSTLIGRRVRVYRNLHKDCWSVLFKGLVVAHAKTVQLKNVQFIVNRGGQERFLREGRKNVHAFVSGELVALDKFPLTIPSTEVTYNPRKAPAFYTVKPCFKGREYYFSEYEQSTHGFCCGKTVFVSNADQ